MQLFLVYFGAALLGLPSDAWAAAAMALTLDASAFLGEIWRGGIQAIPRGQWEAAGPLALTPPRHAARHLPQALDRAAATVGFLVQLLKGTSLAAIIGFTEVTARRPDHQQRHLPAALRLRVGRGDLLRLCWPLSLLSEHLERRLEQAGARTVHFQFEESARLRPRGRWRASR